LNRLAESPSLRRVWHHRTDSSEYAPLSVDDGGRSIVIVCAFALALFFGSESEVTALPSAPLGLNYESALKLDEWSLSYDFERIDRKGLRKGTNRVSASDTTTATIRQVPTEILTTIHTLGIRHAPYERLTVAIQVPLIQHKMKQRDFDDGGDRYTTNSSGVGDFEMVAVVPFMKNGDEKLDVHLGFRFPTGSISNRDDVPGEADEVLLPRSMQTGSCTVAIITGMSYRGDWEQLGWGIHGSGSIGFGENKRDYRHGNRIEFAGWLAHDVTSWLSGSFRLGFDYQRRARRVSRAGPADHLDSFRNATAYKTVDVSPGLSVGVPGLEGQRLLVEASWPIYQDLNGTQVERDWTLSTGWEWVF